MKRTRVFFGKRSSAVNYYNAQVSPELLYRNALLDLRSSIKTKRKKGLKLSPVERHLERSFSHLLCENIISSFAGAAAKSAFVVIRPLIVVCVYTVLLLALVEKSLALFSSSQLASVSESAAGEDMDNQYSLQSGEAEEKQIEVLVRAQDYSAPAALSEPERNSYVEFICGVIAVYHSEISDCGAVARSIVETSLKEGVDPIYITSIIAEESRFSRTARSRVGAMGLMQLMPQTAKALHLERTGMRGYPVLLDPRTNISLGVQYIKSLENQYRGNRFLALAAYNWGPTNVNDAGRSPHRIPRSVRQYSTKILERTLRWKKHYRNAVASAASLRSSS